MNKDCVDCIKSNFSKEVIFPFIFAILYLNLSKYKKKLKYGRHVLKKIILPCLIALYFIKESYLLSFIDNNNIKTIIPFFITSIIYLGIYLKNRKGTDYYSKTMIINLRTILPIVGFYFAINFKKPEIMTKTSLLTIFLITELK